ncbi:MAG: hypothetical protein U0168_28000 [Nannocystaceae bacterium]
MRIAEFGGVRHQQRGVAGVPEGRVIGAPQIGEQIRGLGARRRIDEHGAKLVELGLGREVARERHRAGVGDERDEVATEPVGLDLGVGVGEREVEPGGICWPSGSSVR